MEKNDGLKRIELIMRQYGLSQRQFALKVGISPQTLNTAFKNNGELKLSVIQDILRAFPEISIDWFVMGEGDMMVQLHMSKRGDELVDALKSHIADLQAERDRLIEEKDELRKASGYGSMAAESMPYSKKKKDAV